MQPKDLRAMRLELEWSRAELASALGVRIEDVRAWEEGERPIDSPQRIKHIMDTTRRRRVGGD